MNPCKKCGSYAINICKNGRDESDTDLCDVCYWRKRWLERGREVERLRTERDEARRTAQWLLGRTATFKVESEAIKTWPWLEYGT